MRKLNFRHFYYFWMVAKEGNLTRAAKQLHVSQSAISLQIRQLEEQLGHALFNRDGRKLEPTEIGYLAIEYAESIFNLGSEMMSIMENRSKEKVQRLRIGAVATLSRNFQENFLRPVMGMPEIKLVLRSASLEELIEHLKMHRLDLVLSNRPVSAAALTHLRCERIWQQKVCLVGGQCELFEHLRFPEDLNKVKVVLPGPSSEIRSQFDIFCKKLGITIDPYAEVDDMAMLRLLARDAEGMAVVPEVVVQDEIHKGILKKYWTLDMVIENFYAITAIRHFEMQALNILLRKQTLETNFKTS